MRGATPRAASSYGRLCDRASARVAERSPRLVGKPHRRAPHECVLMAVVGVVATVSLVACNSGVQGQPVTASPAPATVSTPAPPSATPTVTHTPLSPVSDLNLHAVDWSSVSVPGKSCLLTSAIRLVRGQAHLPDASFSTGYRELTTESTTPVYGRLGRGGTAVAALYLTCSTGGGTAGDTLLDSYAVYAGTDGHLSVLGLITARVQPAQHAGAATALSALHFRAGQITVHESYYLPADALCCPLGVADTTRSLTRGILTAGNPNLVAAGHPVNVTGIVTGHDYSGVVWAHDLITDCAANAYGSVMIAFLRTHPCRLAARRLTTFVLGDRQVALSIISAEIPGSAADAFDNAAKFIKLELQDGTGGMNDLLRDGHRIPAGPSAIPASEAFLVLGQDQSATIFDAWYLDGSTAPDAPELLNMENDLFLTDVCTIN